MLNADLIGEAGPVGLLLLLLLLHVTLHIW
jgi:hypothetical protein